MDHEINRLAREIGLPVDLLRQYLPHDEFNVAGWMEQGYTREQAEERAFITDLDNVIVMMNEHAISAKSAISMLKRHTHDPWNYTSSEDEQEGEGAEQKEATGWKRARRDSSDSEGDEKKPKFGANANPGVSGHRNVNA
jgi:hypothetical protein